MSHLRRWLLLPLTFALMTTALAQQKTQTPAKAKKEVAKQKAGTAPKKGEVPASKNPTKTEEQAKPADPMSAPTFTGLKLRSIGPAVTSGRVLDVAVNANNRAQWYVATVGGVWKTNNAGITWTPVFEHEGSFSIATVVIDQNDPNIVWVGTGENNSQRSVSYGDGVYKSEDGGRSWKNVGLKHSEHIGKIIIDPRNSNTVFVAAQGPLWGPGGDRGLYKTTDGGKTWKPVLQISQHTGVTDIAIDPTDPDTMYAAAYQRERHVYTIIDGGPEGGIYKSTNGGETWNKLKGGLPTGEVGKIGIAVAPSNANIVYAYVEGANGKGGIFRSMDKGASWERRNPYDTTAQYYGEIFVDPKNPERIYYPNVFVYYSDDGGKTLKVMNTRSKHVDNHVIWIDPNDTNYYIVGCDGGVYESYDRGETWAFKANLPITQFYDVAISNSEDPFYLVCGGTQDNYSLCGPARTRTVNGSQNADWFVTQGGDGFTSRIDPVDPNTIYSEMQYGGLVRVDRRTGERLDIQPVDRKGEEPSRWNWDSPLIISPHSHTRIYFASQRLYRSDDRGNTWKEISGDLTRHIDRNTLPVMGKVWGADAIAKNASTSFYGNIVSLSESPKQDGLIYVGTDDGLIQVTNDGGAHWTRYEKFANVPDGTYVSRLYASNHDANIVYASFDHHKESDFKPYLLKSTDQGKTWTSIASNLPENGPVLAFIEDPVNPNLLFTGTEFGLYFSIDGGQKWIQLKGGLPTISVHDLAIHPKTDDLVVATFGRGFYILDDISSLRQLKPEQLNDAAVVYPQRDTMMYIESSPIGGRGKGFLGDQKFFGENPPYGATFTYYLKDALKSKKEQRQEAEQKAEKAGKTAPYPSNDELRAEAEEPAPSVFFTVLDADGKPLRRVGAPNKAGMNRVAWDLRYPSPILSTPRQSEGDEDYFSEPSVGPLVLPGKYGVVLSQEVDGKITDLTKPVWFNVYAEGTTGMKEQDRQALLAFQQKVTRLYRSFNGALHMTQDLQNRMKQVKRALNDTPSADRGLTNQADDIEKRLNTLLIAMRGDVALAARNENVPVSIRDRIMGIVYGTRMSTAVPTQTNIDSFNEASQEYSTALAQLQQIAGKDLPALENAMEKAGAPWTPGRIPTYQPE